MTTVATTTTTIAEEPCSASSSSNTTSTTMRGRRHKTSKQPHPKEIVAAAQGVHGVRLKHFERVVASLLSCSSNNNNNNNRPAGASIRPHYVQLPAVSAAASTINETHKIMRQDDPFCSTEGDESSIKDGSPSNPWGCTGAPWPFDRLPPASRVFGTLAGQLSHPNRAKRKEEQVQSVLRCILPLIPNGRISGNSSNNNDDDKVYTLVDFGGGSGHLSIPLALLLPSCRVICVDLGLRSLELLHQKAAHCVNSIEATNNNTPEILLLEAPNSMEQDPSWQKTAIPNLWTFHGPAQAFSRSSANDDSSACLIEFDMAIALHLCGEATDVVLRLAGERQVAAIVVAPCCVGKLQQQHGRSSNSNNNPYVFQATGQNAPTVKYPQSTAFAQCMQSPYTKTSTTTIQQQQLYDWDALAKAADYSDNDGECRTARNAARRTAKALLETDRRLFLQETYQYRTALARMQPWEATPKNDILVAWKHRHGGADTDGSSAAPLENDDGDPIPNQPDLDCETDIQLTIDHLLKSKLSEPSLETTADSASASSTTIKAVALDNNKHDTVDWTREEMEDVRQQLTDFLARTASTDENHEEKKLVFPTGMGGRRRKLVHYMAEQMNLAHWCEGSKHAEKTVAVRRRWQNHQTKRGEY